MDKYNQTKILLDEEMFEKLISGEILEIAGVKIALQDIGYLTMVGIICKKMNDGEKILNTKSEAKGS